MKIITRNGIDIHWWGTSLLIVDHLTSFYICTPVETLLLKYLAISNNISTTVDALSRDLGIAKDDISHFVYIFLENFSHFFLSSLHSDLEKICISGKEGMFYPLELHVSLTNTCRHHCVHCYKSALYNGVFLDTGILKNFLNKMCGYTPYLTLSGGDPILHPDFSDLVNEYGRKYNISVLTSGYKVNQDAIKCLKNATLGVTVSIYSSDAKKHDAFTGVNGSYTSIHDFLLSARENHIPVGVSTMLTTDNQSDIEQLIVTLENLGVTNISIGRIAPIGRASKGPVKDSIPSRKQFISCVNHLGTQFPSVNIWSEDTQFSSEYTSGFRCTAGSFIWAIYENGEIHPCATCTIPELKIGDIAHFDDSILHDRNTYENRISRLPCMQLSDEHPCPFTD